MSLKNICTIGARGRFWSWFGFCSVSSFFFSLLTPGGDYQIMYSVAVPLLKSSRGYPNVAVISVKKECRQILQPRNSSNDSQQT